MAETVCVGGGFVDGTGVPGDAAALRLPGVDLLETIGEGASTVVYRARRDGRDFAVKLLRGAGDERQSAAVRREAALLACLNHPGLARIHDVGAAGGRPYLIMDLVEGRSLRQVLRDGPLHEAQAVRVASEVVDVLTAAHRAGLVHRDVKPENIMIADGGAVRVIDFGLAARHGDASDAAVGTFVYSAPEQTGLLHRAVDARADLYSLGVVLFECLTGAPPFAAADVGELIQMHLSTAPPDLRERGQHVSPALADIVGRLLAKDPDDRYQSGEGLSADLARVRDGERGQFALGTGEVVGGVDSDLIGRDGPAAQLLDRWQQAAAGQGGMVVVEGAPGAGKSRLVRELTSVARAEGRVVLYGSSAADDAVPLAALRSAIDRYVQGVRQLAPAERAAVVTRLRAGCGETAALLRTLCPDLTGLLEIPDVDLGHDERRFADAVATLLVAVAETAGGAVLHLDDLQWWDEATRRVMRRLGPLLAASRLLVVTTARSNADNQIGDPGTEVDLRLVLRPLDADAVESLVVRHLGGNRVPPDLVNRLVARSGGNPLAVQEYVRAVVDAGLVRPSWGAWQLDEAGLDALALPEDVMDLLVHRVADLGGPTRELLTVAAAVGPRFQPDLIAQVCGIDGNPARIAFAEAAAHHLVEAAPDGDFAFLHDRIREALLAEVDPTARRGLHQRIAEALEASVGTGPEIVYATARHYLSGETGKLPDRVFQAATAAGARALVEHAAGEAVYYLSRAAESARSAGIAPDSRFHATLGIAASRDGQYALADEHLDLALASEHDPIDRARLHHERAKSHNLRWECDLAVDKVRLGLAELGHPLPRNPVWYALKTLLLFVAGVVVGRLPTRVRTVTGREREVYALRADLLNTGSHSAAVAMRQPLMVSFTLQSLHLVNRLGPGPAYADTQTCLSVLAMVLGQRRLAERIYARAVRAADHSGDPRSIAHTAWMRGILHDVTPPIHAASGHAMRHALERHGSTLDTGDYLAAIGAIGHVQILRGHGAEVAALYRRGLDRSGMSSEALGNVFATIGAQAAALAGRPAEAASQLSQVRDFVATLSDNVAQRANLAVVEIQLAVEEGETGARFDRAVEGFQALRIKPAFLWAVHHPVWIYQAFGRLAQLAALPPDQRDAAPLARARAAVRRLRRTAKGPVLHAYHRVAAASLRQLTGDHRGALNALRDIESRASGLDLPLLGYEAARVRARAWRGLDRPADARLQASVALLLATGHGWHTRARWIRAEFDVELPDRHTDAGHSGGGGTARRTSSSTAGTAGLHRRRLEALHEVSLAASSVLDPDQVARVALTEVLRIFGAERAFLFLVGADGGHLMPYLGRDAAGTDLDQLTGYGSTLVDRVHHSGEAVVVTGSEEGAALGSQSSLVHGLRSIMVAPLVLKGRLLGVVYLDSRVAKGIFTADDVDILATITNHVAASLETARAAQLEVAVHTARRERDIAESLRAAMNDLTESLDPGEVSDRLVARVTAALPDSTVLIAHRDPAGELTVRLPDGRSIPTTAGPSDLLESATIGHGRVPDRAPPLADLLPAATVGWLAVPLRVRGESRGLLVAATSARPYTDAELQVAAVLAGQGATALDNAMLFRKVEDLATRDGLTGLFNRRHFFELAEHRPEQSTAAVMIDIDHFKSINDTHGHGAGDDVIREVGRRLAGALRDTDVICRYGGEEFAVLLPRTSGEDALRTAERLHAAIVSRPVPTRSGDLPVTVSVGLAEPGTRHGDLPALLTRADEALYRAKRGGRNAVARLAALQ